MAEKKYVQIWRGPNGRRRREGMRLSAEEGGVRWYAVLWFGLLILLLVYCDILGGPSLLLFYLWRQSVNTSKYLGLILVWTLSVM